MQFTLVSALAFAASVSAIMVTAPAANATVDLSKSLKITWSSVDTDPSTINIELVNENVNPPLSKSIASGVQTSSGSYTLNSQDVPTGGNYQINLSSNSSQNTGILAQSGRFDITKAAVSSSSTTSTTSTSSSSSTSRTTTTGSTSGTHSSSTKTTTGSSTSTSTTSSSTASGTSHHTGAASALTISTGGIVAAVFALLM